MIDHQIAAWVDRVDTINFVRDAAGNITNITNTTSAVTLWPVVALTIFLFAVIGFGLGYIISECIRAKESD